MGILGIPGLDGYRAAVQDTQARDANQIGMLGGILGIQGNMLQQGILGQKMALEQRRQQFIDQYAQALPESERAAFILSPENYLKPQAYKPGDVVYQGGTQKFSVPEKPQLVKVNVPDQPGAEQQMWLRPGEPNGIPVGGVAPPKMEVGPAGQVFNPWAVKPGDVMADPNKPFSLGANGQPVPNAPYQNYEISKANAGATRVQNNINAYTPASEEAQRDFIRSTRTTYDQLKQAPVALENIEKAKALVPGASGFMGPGGEALLTAAKFLNNRVGTSINTEGVKDAEELRTRIFGNIMDQLKKLDASPSQQQQAVMQEALGKLGTDPNALPRVLDAFADSIRGKVSVHNQEVQGAIDRGVKFPYDPIIKIKKGTSGGNLIDFGSLK